MSYNIAHRSEIGMREEQQDSWFVKLEEGRACCAVCDGMGGHSYGSSASRAAADTMRGLYVSKAEAYPYPDFFENAIDILDENVLTIQDRSDGQRQPGKARAAAGSAGTTIVSAAVDGDDLYWLSVGDSRLYIIRGRSVARATRDHNYFLRLDYLLRNGEIDKDEYDAEAARGEHLISYLGMGGVAIYDINDTPFKLLDGDMVLLCSDGIYRTYNDSQILALAGGRSPEAAINALFDGAATLFEDNATCVIIKYEVGG